MSQQDNVLASLQIMSESLEETLRQASILSESAIEEEVLIGAENISKNCNNALRYARHIRSQLRHQRSNQRRVR